MPFALRPSRRGRATIRQVLAFAALSVLFVGFSDFLTDARPFESWLFTKLGLIYGYDLLLTLGCASFGLWFVECVCGLGAQPALLKLALALPCGLVAFVAGMYLGGFCAWYGPLFALLLPISLLLLGGLQSGARRIAALWRELFAGPAAGAWGFAAASFGTFGVGLVYLGLLTPDAVNYDASWNHLVIAQDYARAHRITPLIGDWVKNVPHLGSIVNTWAFLVPGFEEPPLRWMQALHTEFTTFLWSLIAVGAAVRFLADRAGVRGAWAALFLFPSILVYDGNMGAAADHYLAVFSVPVLVAGLLVLESTTWRRAVLLGWLAGGGLLTKLHAVYLLIPLAGLIGARIVWLLRKRLSQRADRRFKQALWAALAGVLTAAALLALHFGKNAVYYRNPFYPMAQGTFRSRPTLPDAQLQMDYLFGDWHWHPPARFQDRIYEAAKMIFTFSFFPHYTFFGTAPTFGSLFTLLGPMVFFMTRARRLVLALVVASIAVFTWANTFWVDRSLQTFMPALAAVTGALVVRTWELGVLVRGPLILLVGLQIVWGADYAFSGSERMSSSMALIRSGIDGKARDRFASYRRDYRELGKSLPGNALVVLHNHHVMLGIDRPVLLDWAGYQAVFDYRRYKSPRELHERLRKLGVTHVVHLPGSRLAPTKQEELVFAAYAKMNADETKSFGGLRVFPVSKTPPAWPERPITVLVWNLPNYRAGVYPVEALSSNEEMPAQFQLNPEPTAPLDEQHALEQLAEVDALIARASASFPGPVKDELAKQFTHARVNSTLAVYIRNGAGLTSFQ